MTTRSYPAKLLLFGEYTVLSGSRALAVPLPLWHGEWKTNSTVPDPDLTSLSDYLNSQPLFSADALAKFQREVDNGLHFDSNIPRGYGTGSSGALCAAIYERFFDEDTHEDIPRLWKSLATIECFFHGTSSGMDPLVSFMNAAVLREMDTYHILSKMSGPEGLQIFLIDSGKPRATGALVEKYIEWTKDEDFQINCLRPLVQSVDHAISFFVDNHLPVFWEHLNIISALQFEYFKPMITDSVGQLWQGTLGHPGISIKLCGAGGGGFYLGFAKESVDVKKECPVHCVLLP